jgi:hypothetical protein
MEGAEGRGSGVAVVCWLLANDFTRVVVVA